MSAAPTLRPYAAADEAAALALWQRTWQATYPHIDFAARLDWWRTRWRDELVPQARIIVAVAGGGLTGFVTVDPASGALDQLVVAPEEWGTGTADALMNEGKRIAPAGLALQVNQDNARAIRFYRRHGFVVTGEAVNPRSGAPLLAMRWQP